MILIFEAGNLVFRHHDLAARRRKALRVNFISAYLFVGVLTVGILCGGVLGKRQLSSHGEVRGKAYLDMAQDIAVDSEGNVYVTGYSYSPETDVDFVTIKYDSLGKQMWVDRCDGPAHGTDYAQALEVGEDGDVFVTGHSSGKGTSLDAATIKYSSSGERLWVARYDGPAKRDDWAYDLKIDSRGGAVVGGYSFGPGTEHDYLLLRYSPAGKLQWFARYNSPLNRDDVSEALAIDQRDGVYLSGVDRVRDTAYDMTSVKFDENGKPVGQARYAGPGQVFDAAEAIGVNSLGEVFVTGFGYSEKTGYDMVTIEYDTQGRERWVAKLDGPAHDIDKGLSLEPIPGGGVYVVGLSYGQGTGADCLTVRYDKDGNQVWQKVFNGPGGGADIPRATALDEESNIVVAGYSRGVRTGRDYLLIKYSPKGQELWSARYNGPADLEDAATGVVVDIEGFIYVTGYSHGGETGFDYVTLKFNPEGRLEWKARYSGI